MTEGFGFPEPPSLNDVPLAIHQDGSARRNPEHREVNQPASGPSVSLMAGTHGTVRTHSLDLLDLGTMQETPHRLQSTNGHAAENLCAD